LMKNVSPQGITLMFQEMCCPYRIWDYSLAPTPFASVELFIFNFRLFDLLMAAPCPKEIAPLVWLFISACTA
jgi:hypothetical protein